MQDFRRIHKKLTQNAKHQQNNRGKYLQEQPLSKFFQMQLYIFLAFFISRLRITGSPYTLFLKKSVLG